MTDIAHAVTTDKQILPPVVIIVENQVGKLSIGSLTRA
jgi:hypothetical protein